MQTTAKILRTPQANTRSLVKLAGFSFLFFTLVSVPHYMLIETRILVPLNSLESISQFIEQNELFFRLGILHDLVIFSSGVVLAVALYRLLKSVNPTLALLALLWMVIQAILVIAIEFSSLAALILVGDGVYLSAFDSGQIQSLLAIILDIRAAGYVMVTVFFCLGMLFFMYLIHLAGLLAKPFTVGGLLCYAVMFLGILFTLVIPPSFSAFSSVQVTGQVGASLVMLFQLVIGVIFLMGKVKTI